MQPRQERLVTPRRLLITALLAVAAAGVAFAFTSSRDEVVPARRAGIVRVFPADGTLSLRQDAVGVELAFGYSGVLRLDRVELPDDQLARLNIGQGTRISYTPGEGTETGALSEGRHCASVTFWRTSEGPDTAGPPYTWCFTAS